MPHLRLFMAVLIQNETVFEVQQNIPSTHLSIMAGRKRTYEEACGDQKEKETLELIQSQDIITLL